MTSRCGTKPCAGPRTGAPGSRSRETPSRVRAGRRARVFPILLRHLLVELAAELDALASAASASATRAGRGRTRAGPRRGRRRRIGALGATRGTRVAGGGGGLRRGLEMAGERAHAVRRRGAPPRRRGAGGGGRERGDVRGVDLVVHRVGGAAEGVAVLVPRGVRAAVVARGRGPGAGEAGDVRVVQDDVVVRGGGGEGGAAEALEVLGVAIRLLGCDGMRGGGVRGAGLGGARVSRACAIFKSVSPTPARFSNAPARRFALAPRARPRPRSAGVSGGGAAPLGRHGRGRARLRAEHRRESEPASRRVPTRRGAGPGEKKDTRTKTNGHRQRRRT